jgi:membrane glycosyltransferase
VKWSTQDRGDAETSWRAAIRWHLGLAVFGVVWAVLLWSQDRALFWWLAPVLAGWVLAIPVSVWTSKVSAGNWTRRRGLFLTPEEAWRPAILKDFQEALQTAEARPWANARDGLSLVHNDSAVRAVHLSFLSPERPPKDPLAQHRLEGLRLKLRAHGPAALASHEKRELLSDAESIAALKIS